MFFAYRPLAEANGNENIRSYYSLPSHLWGGLHRKAARALATLSYLSWQCIRNYLSNYLLAMMMNSIAVITIIIKNVEMKTTPAVFILLLSRLFIAGKK
ncbi:hypothetical protein [Mucilaginibacter sp.]|uniref:hypothetical protein n=1 Tax=Mucilaginibacter sp. TaxID=1882438 RepID=UPI0028455EBB|nr:hypothetical protein [Mucilaginibacter sp.]MDR3694350.1 hypothetical protein [Mucilaginibacter sp.]